MLPTEVDVVVVGSGAAGLSAALAAAVTGVDVLVLEASARWGGTTAISGGQVWVPDHQRGPDGSDSFEDALEYCVRHTVGRDVEPIEAFLQSVPRVVQALEKHSPLRFRVAPRIPDSLPKSEGGRTGRHLEPEPIEVGELGPIGDLVWPPAFPMVFTNDEVARLDLIGGGVQPMELFEQRTAADLVCMGEALVIGLLRGCRSAGVQLERDHRVTRLLQDETGVIGLETTPPDEAHHIGGGTTVRVRRGVVLACGGFESEPATVLRLQGEPATLPVPPPVNRGDALRLAGQVGAQIARTSEGWFLPVLDLPGETWPDGSRRPRLVYAERGRPHLIWVNQRGSRFVNEASHNCALALAELDPGTLRLRNHPVWAIGDAQYRASSSIGTVEPGGPAPEWLLEADTLPELAARCELPAAALTETVERYNQLVAAGADTDFGRGSGAYDLGFGDPRAPHPNLGTIERPPFFAVRIHRGTVGSRGGPVTDARARTLGWDGLPIRGLYAAGNAAACVIGPGTLAPGLTLALALTWGWLAGTDAGG
jgi:3-oxosteroid 1-dehydrogenase